MEQTFVYLAILLSITLVVSYIIRLFKQPLIVGYILAGIIIGPFIIQFGASKELIDIFSNFGIAFLLFIVGLHLNPKVIKEVGFTSLVIGLIQMVFTFLIGLVFSIYVLGFNYITSVYIGIALAFSSTIIIMKLLSDKRQLDSLYGKISIGILIIQDLVAIIVLMIIPSFSGGTTLSSFAFRTLLEGGGLIVLLSLTGFLIFPSLIKSIARSQELLFLFSVCWCFVVAALFSYFGFSIGIGALLAGIILSTSPYSIDISARIRPLRDFFLIIFFIILGFNLKIDNFALIARDALLLSALVLIIKPLVLMLFLALFGYTKRTNFLVGTALAQISEFSLIILALGVSLGHISGRILSVVTLSTIITMTFSTYMIIYSNELYPKVSNLIRIFERKKTKEKVKIKKSYDAILFGYNRIGFGILNSLKKIKKDYLVVDFNPDIISSLTKFRVPCLYGDAYDSEFLEELPLDKVQLVVSTIPDFETNFLLVESVRLVNPKAIIIVRSHQIDDALELYRKGASYVLTPHFLGGEYVANMIRSVKTNTDKYNEERSKHIRMLTKMKERGHKHPEVERN
jgi:Kef-type K+ transport system membrane component KefB